MITTKYLTQNRTYTTRKKIITPQYIIVHSTACAYHSKDRLFNSWNSQTKSKSCHGMVDHTGCYLTLPLNYRGWHVGSNGNDKTIGFEICEPSNIAFTTSAHNKVNTAKYDPKDAENIADFNKRYANAVEMAAYMCKETGISVQNVICHAEGYKKGIASNHGDVNHWFPLFGKTMDDFRQDVAAKLNAKPAETENTETEKSETEVLYRVQSGAFKTKKYATALLEKIKAKGFDAYVTYDGTYYRVQTGAFKNKTYAKNLQEKIKAAGFDAIIKS